VGGNEVSVTGHSHCMAVCYPKGKTVMLHSRPLHRASRLLALAVFLHVAFRLYDTVPVFGGLEDFSLRLRGTASGRCGHRRHRVTLCSDRPCGLTPAHEGMIVRQLQKHAPHVARAKATCGGNLEQTTSSHSLDMRTDLMSVPNGSRAMQGIVAIHATCAWAFMIGHGRAAVCSGTQLLHRRTREVWCAVCKTDRAFAGIFIV